MKNPRNHVLSTALAVACMLAAASAMADDAHPVDEPVLLAQSAVDVSPPPEQPLDHEVRFDQPDNIFTLAPVFMPFGFAFPAPFLGIDVTYGRGISDTTLLTFSAGYAALLIVPTWKAGVGLDFHVAGSERRRSGLYVGPRATFRGIAGAVGTDLTGAVGIRTQADGGFTFNIGLNGGYRIGMSDISTGDEDTDDLFDGVGIGGPVVGLELGFGLGF